VVPNNFKQKFPKVEETQPPTVISEKSTISPPLEAGRLNKIPDTRTKTNTKRIFLDNVERLSLGKRLTPKRIKKMGMKKEE